MSPKCPTVLCHALPELRVCIYDTVGFLMEGDVRVVNSCLCCFFSRESQPQGTKYTNSRNARSSRGLTGSAALITRRYSAPSHVSGGSLSQHFMSLSKKSVCRGTVAIESFDPIDVRFCISTANNHLNLWCWRHVTIVVSCSYISSPSSSSSCLRPGGLGLQ